MNKALVFTIRVEDYGDHFQVYKNVPSTKTDRKGRCWVLYNDHGTDIKLGNIWKKNGPTEIFVADDGMNGKKPEFKTIDAAIASFLWNKYD